MRAVILAAGLGSRLFSRTRLRPKCLLKIAGHAILDYQLAALRQCGVHDVVIVVGYRADLVRAHVGRPVVFVENAEYASTGSTYSLWLARDFIREGFLYLNSDLIFHPDLLRRLLEAPEPNGIIIDREVHPAGDMLKAEMEGAQILSATKRPAGRVAAELVGPAKFGAWGARRIAECLEGLIAAGERHRWVYEVFGSMAREIRLVGIDNPGCYWAEVDTPADARDAARRIPAALVDLAAEGTAAAPAERQARPALELRPVPSTK